MNTPHHTWSDSPIHEQIRKMNDTPTPETDEHEFPCMTWALQDHPMVVRADFARKLERELTAVTEQRDEAREKIEFSREWSAAIADIADDLRSELTAVTEQRDRLAEAVNAATILIAAKNRHNTMLAYEGLRAAIQFLTPKP